MGIYIPSVVKTVEKTLDVLSGPVSQVVNSVEETFKLEGFIPIEGFPVSTPSAPQVSEKEKLIGYLSQNQIKIDFGKIFSLVNYVKSKNNNFTHKDRVEFLKVLIPDIPEEHLETVYAGFKNMFQSTFSSKKLKKIIKDPELRALIL